MQTGRFGLLPVGSANVATWWKAERPKLVESRRPAFGSTKRENTNGWRLLCIRLVPPQKFKLLVRFGESKTDEARTGIEYLRLWNSRL